MSGAPLVSGRKLCFAVLLLLVLPARTLSANSWKGIVHDKPGHAVGEATVSLQATSGSRVYSANTSASGEFFFADIAAQSYRVAVKVNGKTWNAVAPLVIKDGGALAADLELSEHNQTLVVLALANPLLHKAVAARIFPAVKSPASPERARL